MCTADRPRGGFFYGKKAGSEHVVRRLDKRARGGNGIRLGEISVVENGDYKDLAFRGAEEVPRDC